MDLPAGLAIDLDWEFGGVRSNTDHRAPCADNIGVRSEESELCRGEVVDHSRGSSCGEEYEIKQSIGHAGGRCRINPKCISAAVGDKDHAAFVVHDGAGVNFDVHMGEVWVEEFVCNRAGVGQAVDRSTSASCKPMDDAGIGAHAAHEQAEGVVDARDIGQFGFPLGERPEQLCGIAGHGVLAGEEIFGAQREVIDGCSGADGCVGGMPDGSVASDDDEGAGCVEELWIVIERGGIDAHESAADTQLVEHAVQRIDEHGGSATPGTRVEEDNDVHEHALGITSVNLGGYASGNGTACSLHINTCVGDRCVWVRLEWCSRAGSGIHAGGRSDVGGSARAREGVR